MQRLGCFRVNVADSFKLPLEFWIPATHNVEDSSHFVPFLPKILTPHVSMRLRPSSRTKLNSLPMRYNNFTSSSTSMVKKFGYSRKSSLRPPINFSKNIRRILRRKIFPARGELMEAHAIPQENSNRV